MQQSLCLFGSDNLNLFFHQAQLRAFIPEMLKYSTGRSKPGWGKAECRPPWWPNDVPWANVRSDVRSEEEKKKVCGLKIFTKFRNFQFKYECCQLIISAIVTGIVDPRIENDC